MMRATSPQRSRGFTLLEALVALVIFSMAAIGIYSWINTNLISLNRVAEVAATEQVLNSSIERLKLVDLSTETSGRFNVNGYWVDWSAELVEPWKQGMGDSGQQSLYDLGLYLVTLGLSKDQHSLGQYSYRQVTYKRVREQNGDVGGS